ncbi:thiol-specific antioxidant protein 3 [Tremella mesenterica]|uniref:Thiol-specific antioxidant protein 3 n=1 Tax=Tremella mesenterica TaxID=5217 RepID=A0A4Q1BML5_TREME|nr:thiol-specific antioxidant protein 3 [Tremella mesenterica DSM 1558]EIW73318.1 thiol-specific antioxidant protein 3 [Tremella mesenterica DSM 1558]RXK39078.1 thiol-specific antioxidant protein 3 [Tremella mesenterica]
MSLRLGDVAPDFEAETTAGKIKFHDWLGDSWAILFSHPDDYTPVCTTELSAVALSYADFQSRGVKLIGLSVNDVNSHEGWKKDIEHLVPDGPSVEFPIIADKDRKVSELYGMLDHLDATNVDAKGLPFTVRTVFIIDPSKKIRLFLAYPASTGRSFPEILRVIDSLQLGDKYKITTPANWNIEVNGKKEERVIVHPSVQGENVKKLFGDNVEIIYPYLRFTPNPEKTKASA